MADFLLLKSKSADMIDLNGEFDVILETADVSARQNQIGGFFYVRFFTESKKQWKPCIKWYLEQGNKTQRTLLISKLIHENSTMLIITALWYFWLKSYQ